MKSYEIHKSDKIENLDELTRILYYSNESVTNALHFRYDNDVFYVCIRKIEMMGNIYLLIFIKDKLRIVFGFIESF